MHRFFVAALAAGLLLAASFPAFAQDVVVDPVNDGSDTACANDEELDVVSTDVLVTDIVVPGFDLDQSAEVTRVLVDLGTSDSEITGQVQATLTWDRSLNDFDLVGTSQRSDELSDSYQPEAAAEETVTLTVGHCEVIALTAVNFFAPLAAFDTLTLGVEVVDENPVSQDEEAVTEDQDAAVAADEIVEDIDVDEVAAAQ